MEILTNFELLRLLKYYNDNTLLADEEFVLRATDIIIRHWHLSAFVEKVKINLITNMNVSYYDAKERTIYIYIDHGININKILDWDFLNKKDQINAYNLFVISLILKALNKVRYFAEDQHEKSFKGYLLQKSLEDDVIKAKLANEPEIINSLESEYIKRIMALDSIKHLYPIDPCERMAQIDANIKVSRMHSRLGYVNPELVSNYFGFNLTRSMLIGYEINNGVLMSPTERFLKLINHDNDSKGELHQKLEDIASEFETGDNLYYGLPVDRKEFDKVVRRMRAFKNYAQK